MTNTHTETPHKLEEGVYHYLLGYFQANPARAKEVMAYPNWQERARLEMERRITRMLETFDDETIQALAEGTISMNDIAARVLAKGADPKD